MPARKYQEHRRPLWLAALIAPLALPIFASLFLTVWVVASEGTTSFSDDWRVAAGVALVVLPFSYGITWLIGVPVVLWLRRCGQLSVVSVCASSLVLGAATTLAMALLNSGTYSIAGAAIGAGLGLIVGIAFCIAAGITTPWSKARPAASVGSTGCR